MTNQTDGLSRTYPRDISLGGKAFRLRIMEPADGDTMLAFAQGLPPDDMLFLRLDIATPEGIREWVTNIEAGRTVTVLAEHEGAIVGYASVHHNAVLWNRHVGEIRVIVAPQCRRTGLGRRLTSEVFSLARDLGLRKITAQMTPDQKGARATFERLGFRPEALLADYVIDRDGRTRDLLVMSNDIDGFTDVEHSRAGAASAS